MLVNLEKFKKKKKERELLIEKNKKKLKIPCEDEEKRKQYTFQEVVKMLSEASNENSKNLKSLLGFVSLLCDEVRFIQKRISGLEILCMFLFISWALLMIILLFGR